MFDTLFTKPGATGSTPSPTPVTGGADGQLFGSLFVKSSKETAAAKPQSAQQITKQPVQQPMTLQSIFSSISQGIGDLFHQKPAEKLSAADTFNPVVFSNNVKLSLAPGVSSNQLVKNQPAPIGKPGESSISSFTPTIWDKIGQFFNNVTGKDALSEIARAQNAYSVVGKPDTKAKQDQLIALATPGGNILKNSPMENFAKTHGIATNPTNSEFTTMLMTAAAGFGLSAAPAAALKTLGIFSAVNEIKSGLIAAVKGQGFKLGANQSLSDLSPTDNPTVNNVLDLVDLLGTGSLTGAIYKHSPAIFDKLTKDVFEKYKVPASIQIAPEGVRAVIKGLDTGPTRDALAKLEMTGKEWRKAAQDGISVDLPTERIVTIADKPFWATLKKFARIPGAEPIVKTEKVPAGPVTGFGGYLTSGKHEPQEIINEIFTHNIQETPEGAAALRTAIEAQRRGEMVTVEKPGEPAKDIPGVVSQELNKVAPDAATVPQEAPVVEPLPTEFANKELIHTGARTAEQVKTEGLHLSRNAAANLGKAVYFSDSKQGSEVYGGNTQAVVNTKDFNLKVVPTIAEEEALLNKYNVLTLGEAVTKEGYDGFIIPNKDPKVGNTYGIVNLEKVNKIVKVNVKEAAPPPTPAEKPAAAPAAPLPGKEKLTMKPAKEKVPDPTGRIRITKADIKTMLANSDEFKNNPVLTVRKTKEFNGEKTDLFFEGGKHRFIINADALGLNSDALKAGEQIYINSKDLGGNVQQMHVYNGAGVYASVGDYAELPNRTNGSELSDIVQFPELLRIAKDLLGSTPDVRAMKRNAAGFFTAHDNGKITLNAEIFKNPQQAAKILAHELGHLIDYLPEKNMKRGNLLGRIASLRKYMGSMLKEFPGSPGELLTAKDRARIRAAAKKGLKGNYEEVTREIVKGKEPVKPEEILSIWRDATGSIKNKELLSYISRLSDERKKEIVVAAMRNKIPDWVTFVHEVKETITEKVLRNAPGDIRALYKKMLHEEILKRRLIELETVKKELMALSMKWRPYNPNLAPARYNEYRAKPEELYADAISVLFNDPVMLKEDAPVFWKAFFDYLDTKPEVKAELMDTYDLLHKGEEAVLTERESDIREMFKKGEDLFQIKVEENKLEKRSFLFRLRYDIVDKNQALIEDLNRAKKEGKPVSDDENPIYWLEGHDYVGGKIKSFLESKIQPLYSEIQTNGLTWEDLGEVLFLERAINERGKLANPLGYAPDTAQRQLDYLKEKLGDKWAVIEKALPLYRDAVKSVIDPAAESGLWNPELIKELKANPSYATFQVLDYMEVNIPASIRKQTGTLKEVANPASATIVKTVSILRAIERNNMKRSISEFYKKNFPEDITPAETKFNGKAKVPLEPRDRNLALFEVMEGGKITGYYVDPYIAKSVEYMSTGHANAVLQIVKLPNRLIFRPLFISLNLGFQSFNLARDFFRFYKNTPGLTFGKAIARYIQALGPSRRSGFGVSDALISQMEKEQILSLTYNDLLSGKTETDSQIDYMFQKYNLVEGKQKSTKLQKFWDSSFGQVFEFIERTGNTIERLPKVAAYKELNGKMPPKEFAAFIRNNVGSPNFLRKSGSYAWLNEVALFSNAIKEGIRSDYNVAFKDPRTRGGYWWKSAWTTLLPKFVMYAALLGFFGENLKKMMTDVSEYDKTSYTVVPLGMEGEKTIYMRVPMDETGRLIGGLLWKILRLTTRKDIKPEDIADVVSYGGGQVPNLSPIIGVTAAIAQYVAGNNPYDFFRGRTVLPDQVFKAGPWSKYALIPFSQWVIQQLGGSIVLGNSITEKTPTTHGIAEQVTTLPLVSNIVGRWIKVSNYGQAEENKRITDVLTQKAAQKSLEKKSTLNDALSQYQENPRNKQAIQRQLVADVIGKVKNSQDKRARTLLIQSFNEGILRSNNDPLTNSLLSATTNEQKAQLLIDSKGRLGGSYNSYVQKMLAKKVISKDVLKQIRKQ